MEVRNVDIDSMNKMWAHIKCLNKATRLQYGRDFSVSKSVRLITFFKSPFQGFCIIGSPLQFIYEVISARRSRYFERHTITVNS